jgi:hypothetical protein
VRARIFVRTQRILLMKPAAQLYRFRSPIGLRKCEGSESAATSLDAVDARAPAAIDAGGFDLRAFSARAANDFVHGRAPSTAPAR